MNMQESFLRAIRFEIDGKPMLSDPIDDHELLYRFAKTQDMTHLIADALWKNDLLPADPALKKAYEDEQMLVLYRETSPQKAEWLVREILKNGAVSFMMLKGAHIRALYPESWMRTSCDVDVLVHEDDLERAISLLCEKGFTAGTPTAHDVPLYLDEVHVELHFSLRESWQQPNPLLETVWEHAVPVDDCEYREEPAFFAAHHIAHMARHFLYGGCGVKAVMDLWILQKNNVYEEKALLSLLEPVGLTAFYRSACDLIRYWFSDADASPLTQQMSVLILSGGVYGSEKNRIALGVGNRQGRFDYLWRRAVPSFSTMCKLYPSLEGKKYLLPVYYVRRFFSRLFGRGNARRKVNMILTQSGQEMSKTSALLDALGLE